MTKAIPCCMGSAVADLCTCQTPAELSEARRDAAELAMYRREFPVIVERHRLALAELAEVAR